MTITKTKVLTFEEHIWQKPIVCTLAKQFDLDFSILKAKVLPRRAGLVVLELIGEQAEFDKALTYLREQGVGVQSMEQEIYYHEELCTQCGACVGFCPSEALTIEDRSDMKVIFIADRCIGCEVCLTACPARALTVSPELRSFEANIR